jgi:hypothetical protein
MAIVHTRRPLLGRLKARLHCAYIRWVIRCAEQDMARHKAEFEHASRHLPKQIELDRKHIASLTARLIKEDRNA